MNWSALAAIAELVAALGVIVSLVYLGAQIRHGSLQVAEQGRSQRLVALADVAQRFTEFRKSIAGDGELASIWLRGRRDLQALDEAERVRFDYLAAEMFWAYAMLFLYREEDRLAESLFESSVPNLKIYGAGIGIADWWRTSSHRSEYPDEFRAAVDDLLLAPAAATEARP